MATSGSSRSFLFVIHNYSKDVVERLRIYGDTSCRYLCFGYEICPDTGTPHLQGYVSHDEKKSLNAFQRYIWPEKKFHMTITSGTGIQNKTYCSKPQTKDPAHTPNFEEFGNLPAQGSRTDYAAALAQINSGTPVEEVVDSQPHLLPMIRAIESYKLKKLKALKRQVEVIVLWGDAGSGKSRWAYDNYPNLYSKPPSKQSGAYFDGYTGQDTLLLDDFYGDIKYSDLLRVLDIYPYNAPVSGAHVWAQWTTVIITSNKPPEEWYSHGLTPALKRRLHKIFFYSIDAPPTPYEP